MAMDAAIELGGSRALPTRDRQATVRSSRTLRLGLPDVAAEQANVATDLREHGTAQEVCAILFGNNFVEADFEGFFEDEREA